MNFFKSANMWLYHKQESGYLVHFLRLLAVRWPDAEVHETTTFFPADLNKFHLQDLSLKKINGRTIVDVVVQTHSSCRFLRSSASSASCLSSSAFSSASFFICSSTSSRRTASTSSGVAPATLSRRLQPGQTPVQPAASENPCNFLCLIVIKQDKTDKVSKIS